MNNCQEFLSAGSGKSRRWTMRSSSFLPVKTVCVSNKTVYPRSDTNSVHKALAVVLSEGISAWSLHMRTVCDALESVVISISLCTQPAECPCFLERGIVPLPYGELCSTVASSVIGCNIGFINPVIPAGYLGVVSAGPSSTPELHPCYPHSGA